MLDGEILMESLNPPFIVGWNVSHCTTLHLHHGWQTLSFLWVPEIPICPISDILLSLFKPEFWWKISMLEGEIHLKSIEIANPTVKTGGKIPNPAGLTQVAQRCGWHCLSTDALRHLAGVCFRWATWSGDLVGLGDWTIKYDKYEMQPPNLWIQHDSTWFNHSPT